MTTTKITPIILAGGRGRRLWPLSTQNRPKQFIPLSDGQTLFGKTIQRCASREIFNPPIIVGNVQYKQIIKALSPHDAQILIEPEGKNTAAAIALATMAANKNEILLIVPTDHIIPDQKAFIETITKGIAFACNEKLVTFGIHPTSAHTGFGYIQTGQATGEGFTVKKFHEKPKKRIAKQYSNDNQFFWNAGIYMAQAQTFINEFNIYAPYLLSDVSTPESFKYITPISFDHAVAEKTQNAVVIPAEFEWSDIGSWQAYIKLKAGTHE